jgi:hypothetical protein
MKKLLLKIAVILSLFAPAVVSAQVPVNAGGTGLTTVPAGECLKGLNSIRLTTGPCGSGGSGGGTFSTTTSNVSGRLINYPNNGTDIVCIGGTATTTCEFYLDPNTQTVVINGTSTTRSALFDGGPWVDAKTCGAKGDGVTDDSAAINTCITNLGNAGGGKLYISANYGRTAMTKYSICAGPITMKPFVTVEVQPGVEIQVCNGYASSTVQFISGATGTYFAKWKGGKFTEAGTPQKLWTAFNVESQNINGGVFWNTISDAVIYFPSVAIRSSVIGSGDGWLNSNTYRDIVVSYPTNAFTFNDDRTGAFVIAETLFDNVQVQTNISTESCFKDLKGWNTQIINGFCYDMVNATSTSLTIDGASISTLIEGGYLTAYNFVDNGQRTVMVGDRLWPFYATSTVGSMYVYANGAVLIGTSTTNATSYPLNIIDSTVSLGIGTSRFNSKIGFYTAGAGNHQQDFCQAATTTGQSPNSGNIFCSVREGFFIDLDSDQTSTAGKFAIRSNRSDGGVSTTGELLSVTEPGVLTVPYASTTVLSNLQNTYLGTSGVAGTNYNLYLGTTTPMLQTNTGAGANVGNLLSYNKQSTLTPGFVSVVTAALQTNAAGVFGNGNGPCYSTYEGSNTSGRTMWADCAQYYNTLSSIGASRVNFITNSSGVLTPWQYVTQTGNVTIGATTTDISSSLARLNVLNVQSSTQDIFHADQGIGTATSTVFTIKSTGFTGIATSSPHQALTVNGNAYIAGFVTSTSTTAASTFPYASTTGLSVGGRTIAPTYDKSLTWASSTPDANFKSFNTATTSRVIWLPTLPIGLATLGCQVTGGSGTAHIAIGTGLSTTTLPCTTTYASVTSTVTWTAGSKVYAAASSTAPNGVQDLVITGAFYNQ